MYHHNAHLDLYMADGWICLDKPAGISSNYAMILVRKLMQTKTGYVGTLDPFATGILLIAVGRARHFIKYTDENTKTYVFTIQFGAITDTLDSTGNILENNGRIPTISEVKSVLHSFVGEINQLPPKYSAIKINGRRACDLIRSGKDVELPSRKVRIFSLNLLSEQLQKDGTVTLEVFCSKGTYVRSLARDIADKLETLGYVTSLRRITCGLFEIKNTMTLEKLREIVDTSEIESVLIPIDAPLGDIPAISLESSEIAMLLHGRPIEVEAMSYDRVRIYDNSQRFFGVCEVCDNCLLKPSSMYINNEGV